MALNDPTTDGQVFVRNLIISTCVLLFLYCLSHIMVSYSGDKDDKKLFETDYSQCIRLTPYGEMVLLDSMCISWIVGEEKATKILKRMETRTGNIRILMSEVEVDMIKAKTEWKNIIGNQDGISPSPLIALTSKFQPTSCEENCTDKCQNTSRCDSHWLKFNSSLAQVMTTYQAHKGTEFYRSLGRISEDTKELIQSY